ncbi:hypothetical protein BMR1_03g02830 [Babesia microti strain RI]|uniref:Uncharacterized protein n=1 Tax=Babesia microti (strain RI) TaxID=1133968 RepID=A0A0K3AU95_BABMR|nr:hypothetical protein BMR1_03g02830 [Babesia microti strain RI]CTQ41166.1 hypothetical protein BMR1_03g02830 [Babesia microti strain RI]|eukprot:XP_012649177.1 hypothetical protein BMR1_03g02830 [Babesia microti strain RI]
MESQGVGPRYVFFKVTSIFTLIVLFLILFTNVCLLIRKKQMCDVTESGCDAKAFVKNLKLSGVLTKNDIEEFKFNHIDTLYYEINKLKNLPNYPINNYKAYISGDSSKIYLSDLTGFFTPSNNSVNPSNSKFTHNDTSKLHSGISFNMENYVKWEEVDRSKLINLTNAKFATMEIIDGRVIIRNFTPLSVYLEGHCNCKNFYQLKPIDLIPFRSIKSSSTDNTNYDDSMVKNTIIITCKEYADEIVSGVISRYLDDNQFDVNKYVMGETTRKLKKPDKLTITNHTHSDTTVSTLDAINHKKYNNKNEKNGVDKKKDLGSDESIAIIDDSELYYDYFSDGLPAPKLDEYIFDRLVLETSMNKLHPSTPTNSIEGDTNDVDNTIIRTLNNAAPEVSQDQKGLRTETMDVCIPLWIDGECLGLQVGKQIPLEQNYHVETTTITNSSSNNISVLPKTLYLPTYTTIDERLEERGTQIYETGKSNSLEETTGTEEFEQSKEVDDKDK